MVSAFMLSNIIIEIPWQSLAGLFLFVCWYYPIGLYRNAEPTHSVNERGALTFILMQQFMWFVSVLSLTNFTLLTISDIDVCSHGRCRYPFG
jgi:ATP-binding cassette subfamily G (WHITE) protein 2 (PDR)